MLVTRNALQITHNVGPKDYGRIPIIMEERLLDIGAWLQVNGEAIYSTRTWVHSQKILRIIFVEYSE
jgi:alpha-L-fucosidase